MEVFCLWVGCAERICFWVDDGGAKLGRLLGWCFSCLACCRPCPPAGTGYPDRGGTQNGEGRKGNLGGRLLGWTIFLSVGLVWRKGAEGLWPRRVDCGLLAAVPLQHPTVAAGALCVWLTESRCRCAQRNIMTKNYPPAHPCNRIMFLLAV